MEGYHEGNPLISGAYHMSVLPKELLEALNIKKDAWYLDCTLGDGGHSLEIIRHGGKVIGIDVDPQALKRVETRFREEGIDRFKFKAVKGNFRDIKNLIEEQTETKFAGAIFDLGVSSLQLEDPRRGFSFTKVGPLDMRMDPSLEVRALDLIRVGGRKELYELFKNLGEEKNAWTLADAVVSARKLRQIQTTRDLAEIVERTLGRRGKIPARIDTRSVSGRHPATKIFQALRIAVNDELKALEEGLEEVKSLIEKNGYIIVISFHSLEDRIVKFTFKRWADQGFGEIVTKKPLVPSEQEVFENPRSRSAKMRVFVRRTV